MNIIKKRRKRKNRLSR